MFTTLAHVLDKSALYGKGISPARILLANSLRLLPLHCVERAGARKLRGSFTKAAALWIRQQ
jgi:hypothetical protein